MTLITLERWLQLTYADDAPAIDTARKWARTGKIYPQPEKHGRSYFVVPSARYTDCPPKKPRLVDRIHAEAAQAGQHGPA